ncbi:MAG: peptidylprolyl isomerase [Acidobacteriaceae bacterium]|nr:peptidylprolyl isomerase [Acidobacteriaceae bacterium]MBV9781720.1 peptidylprolyl isomerase [Acidobacteriaceae bacterium]
MRPAISRVRPHIVLFALLSLAACRSAVSTNVAAAVNGRPVTYSDLDRAIAAQFPNSNLKPNDDQTIQLRLDTLRALIDNEIMLQRAEKEGLLAADGDVEAKFNELKAGYTEEQFQKLLSQRKMSVADFKAQIRRDLSVQKLFNKEIGSHISISDADVAAFYNSNKATFNLSENQVRLAQILVTPTPDANVHNLKNDKAQSDQQARNKIQMIELRLRQGEDFGALAQNYSEDASAANGGDLGFVPESTLDKANPELRKLILDMTPGQVSQMIHTAEGYRLIKLISREPAGQRELSDPRVQENIRRELFQRKDQLLRSAFYEVARSEAKVSNYYAESVLASRDKK